jgi:hypothetical protein
MCNKRLRLSSAVIFILFGCLACASTPKKDVESELIAAMAANCKTVEMKVDGGREVYVIDPTLKLSVNGCPTAIIRGWREGAVIMEKEVEVCACKESH